MSSPSPYWLFSLLLLLCLICFSSPTAHAQGTGEETPLDYWRNKSEATPATADEAQLKQLHSQLWAAIEHRNLTALRQLWSSQPAATAAFEKVTKLPLLTGGKCELLFIRAVYLTAAEHKGMVRSFTATRRFEAGTDKLLPEPGRYMYTTRFVQEDGLWKINDFSPTLGEMAEQMAAASTVTERETIWQAFPDAQVIELNWAATQRGFGHYRQGNYAAAQRFFELGYWLGAEKFRLKLAMAISLTNLGAIALDRNDYAKSLDYSLRAAALLRELSDVRMQEGLAHTTNNIGEVYKKQGNYELALQYLNESLRVAEANHFQFLISERLINLAGVYQEQGRMNLAQDALERGYRLAEELKNPLLIAETQLALAQLHVAQTDFQRAATEAKEALTGFGEAKFWKANALTLYGQALFGLGQYEQAIEQLNLAIPLAQETGQREAIWEARTTQGQALRALGRLAEAHTAFTQAIQVIEEVRTNLTGDETLRRNFFVRKLAPYRETVELLLTQKEVETALQYAEQGKARALLEVLQSGQSNLTKALTPLEQETERRLNSELAELNSQLLGQYSSSRPPDLARVQALREALQKKRLEQTDFTTRLYATRPTLKLQRGQTAEFSLPKIAEQLLDKETALLEYVVGSEQTQLFLVTQEQGKPLVRSWSLSVKNALLRSQVSQYRSALASRDLRFLPQARALYQTLLEPAAAQLQGKTKLVIVPDSFLWELPFQALQSSNNQYVAEQYALAYAPSLSALSEMKQLKQKRQGQSRPAALLALGNPALPTETPTIARLRSAEAESLKFAPLPQAEQEVKTIAHLYGSHSKVYVGESASEATFKQQASQYDVLHVAAHGYLNNQAPLYSFLVLSQEEHRAALAQPNVGINEDGLLEAWELMRLELNPSLVVLSACETARGQISEGEGVIGLSWALFVAGAPTAVVSQWKVDASSTTDLMIEFHRERRAQPTGAAPALRQAALKLLRGKYKHPFYWAGFVVMGEGF